MDKKVLIISMNALSDVKNNGKTMETIFYDYDKSLLSHVFFIMEEEDLNFCNKSLRFNAYDALDNLLRIKKRPHGEELYSSNNDIYKFDDSIYYPFVRKKYKRSKQNWGKKIPIDAKKRNGRSYLITEVIWFQKKWYYKKISAFLKNQKPDVIFYQANLYSFLHKVVYEVSKEFNIPIIIQCTDDYTLPQLERSYINKVLNRYYMSNFKRLMKRSKALLAISDLMASEYSKLYFKGKSFVFSNYVDRDNTLINYAPTRNKRILYAGNLGLNRWRTIVSFGKALDKYNQIESHSLVFLDIYSADNLSDEMKEGFHEIKSVRFKGFITNEILNSEIEKSDYLFHCESFNQNDKKVTRLSISTKIGEYICSNRCIIAIGPDDIASIKYLKENELAKVITTENVEDISKLLTDFFGNENESEYFLNNATNERKNRFNRKHTNDILKEMIDYACEK